MVPISSDLRQRIFDARQAGETTSEVAERFAVSPAFVRRLLQRHRESGTLLPLSGRRGPKCRLEADVDRIRALHAEQPDLFPGEIRDRLGLNVAAITVWRMLRRLGLSFKKSRSGPPNRIDPMSPRPDRNGPQPSLSAWPND